MLSRLHALVRFALLASLAFGFALSRKVDDVAESVDTPAHDLDLLATILARMEREQLQTLFQTMDRIYLPRPVSRYIARLVSATHPGAPEASEGSVNSGDRVVMRSPATFGSKTVSEDR